LKTTSGTSGRLYQALFYVKLKVMTKGKFIREKNKRRIEELSWGLTFRLTDLTLITLFLGLTLSMPSKHSSKFWAKTFTKIRENLDEDQIKRAFYGLKKDGLIDYTKRLWQNPQITAAGRKRLAALLPQYDKTRTWDKRLYLITYDIPEKKKWRRDQLRAFLKKIGCGRLQESTWITPYNPKELIENFVTETGLDNLILVSDLGKDGQVGQESLRSLVDRVYCLTDINERYRQFLEDLKSRKIRQSDAAAYFFSILRDDPQLPFELLPDGWLGEQAWEKINPSR